MTRRSWITIIVSLIVFLGAAGALWFVLQHGFSTRPQPGRIETFIARRLRHLAVPTSARNARNPIPSTDDVLNTARAHFADHCALCHANDGSGQTEIGRNLYPKAPDMRGPATQSLTDGELFYIIHNGIRFTGMPAWGDNGAGEDEDSWELVHFIRHLPQMTKQELEDMKESNPVSRQELKEEQEMQEFLQGGEPDHKPASTMKHH